ncbi:MAG TPA: bacteriohopanetetrol glucosamine biosynthesis glycosyltransferase HpnI [Candidatus Binatia bacterium]|nr:bacteriohopanetetrol glucosamine biosynthesis glycosyltransferase HpnI [Candidatus Binatia bacterium]
MYATLLVAAGAAHFQHFVRQLLWDTAVFGSFTSTLFFGMVMVASLRYVLNARAAERELRSVAADALPAVTILKPVHGLEPRLEETLESFFRQDYPQFEILFGARSREDEALGIVEKLRARYPQVRTRVIISGEPSWPNAKVFSLAKMIAACDSSFLIISDSDVVVGPDYLRNVMPPLLDPRVGLVTCLYQGIPAQDFWSHLDALGMSVELPSGVMVVDMMEGMRFALGAAIAVRRDAIEAIGGMRETADFYSDDFVLGKLVAAAGYRVVLSHYKVGHVLADRSLARTLGDQLRWMKSTRFSRPWGHVGSGLTYAVPFGLLALLLGLGHPQMHAGLELFLMSWLNRMLLAVVVGWAILRDRRALWLCWLYPLRDLLGFCTWAASFSGSRFFWRGELYQFGDEGRILPVHRSIEFIRDRLPQAHD